MSKLSVLMTVYNEAEFVEYAIRSCLPHVDHLVIVEGAYQETIALGANPRSTDFTIEKIEDFNGLYYDDPEMPKHNKKITYIEANEQSDKDQRNVGLEKIKELNPNGWCLIIDGDEVYTKENFDMIKVAMKNFQRSRKYAAYFKSLTFVNDMKHFTEQDFPRLFRITPKCTFVNDNHMAWPDAQVTWSQAYVLRIPYIRYHHYAFCKGLERFELKKKWWESRFKEPFNYGWQADDKGVISDPNHEVFEYTGSHPSIIQSHPEWKKSYET